VLEAATTQRYPAILTVIALFLRLFVLGINFKLKFKIWPVLRVDVISVLLMLLLLEWSKKVLASE